LITGFPTITYDYFVDIIIFFILNDFRKSLVNRQKEKIKEEKVFKISERINKHGQDNPDRSARLG